jgi:hypothetical protein
MRLIGINGFMHSGKDTTYEFIKDALVPEAVERRAFADKLKEMAAMAIGIEEGDLIEKMNDCKENWTFDVEGALVRIPGGGKGRQVITAFTGRQYLQWLGGNARKVFGDTFWIDQVLPMSDTSWPEKGTLVVTDVRYPNEAERIKLIGGEVWEIIRPGLTSDGHSSEIPLEPHLVDKTIVNDGSLDDLEKKVKESL